MGMVAERSDDERPSRLEGLTIWGRAKAILLGKSRGRNMLVLGIFLVVISGIADAMSATTGIPTETGTTLRMLGIIAFVWGGMLYMRGD